MKKISMILSNAIVANLSVKNKSLKCKLSHNHLSQIYLGRLEMVASHLSKIPNIGMIKLITCQHARSIREKS